MNPLSLPESSCLPSGGLQFCRGAARRQTYNASRQLFIHFAVFSSSSCFLFGAHSWQRIAGRMAADWQETCNIHAVYMQYTRNIHATNYVPACQFTTGKTKKLSTQPAVLRSRFVFDRLRVLFSPVPAPAPAPIKSRL